MVGMQAWHTQYIASTADGRDLCATHLLFDGIIQEAEKRGVRFVSFGRSSEEGGRLNRGLFAFKSGFGAGAVCHDTYLVSLA
jgi:lipid II:glycine glycyltransferase (peptidoglycan interpeptide bridge formation enzyme)